MAATTGVEPLFRGNTSKNTRGLLRIIILCTIAAAAISARLFSVIRMPCCPPISVTKVDELSADSCSLQDLRVSYMNVRAFHPWNCLEQTASTFTQAPLLTLISVDPWFNFRATKYLIKHGFYSFWDWFDDRKLEK